MDLSKASMFVPGEIDKIVWGDTITFDMSYIAGTVQEFEFPTGLGNGSTAYPIGIYTSDGGSTYNDVGTFNPAAAPGTTIVAGTGPNLQLEAVFKTDGTLVIRAFMLFDHGPKTVTVNYALVAFDPFSAYVPTDNQGQLKAEAYRNDGVYRQIEESNILTSSPVLTTVPHSMGAVPFVHFWYNSFDPSAPAGYIQRGTFNQAGVNNISSLKVDASNVYFSTGDFIILSYKLHKDNHL